MNKKILWLFSNVLSAFLLKIPIVYTTFFYIFLVSESEFGSIQLFLTYTSIALPLLTFSTYAGFGRYLYDTGLQINRQQGSYLILVAGMVALVGSLVLLIPLSADTKLVMIIVATITSSWVFDISLQQIAVRTNAVIKLNIFLIMKYSLVVAMFAGSYHFYTRNVLYALCISEFLGLSASVVFYCKKLSLKHLSINYAYLRKIMVFSLPLMAYYLSAVLLSQIDRVMLARFTDLQSVGIYALAYNAASFVTVGMNGVFNMLLPQFFKDKEVGKTKFSETIPALFSYVTIFTSLSLALFCIYLVVGNVDPDMAILKLTFIAAISLIPSVIVQYFARELQFEKRTLYLSFGLSFGAIVNILLNLLLIPSLGLYGAVFSTFCAYVCVVFYFGLTAVRQEYFSLLLHGSKCLVALVVAFGLIFFVNIYLGAAVMLAVVAIEVWKLAQTQYLSKPN